MIQGLTSDLNINLKIQMLVLIALIFIVIFLVVNDEAFLRPGQQRGFFGIYDANGELNIMDTLMEQNGMGGNPLFWDYDWD